MFALNPRFEVWYFDAETDEYLGTYPEQFDTTREAEAIAKSERRATGWTCKVVAQEAVEVV